MNGNPVASARPSAWLAIPALPSCKTQAIGDGSLGVSSNMGASVGATEAIASVYASRLHAARMPLDHTMTISARADPFTTAERVLTEGDSDDLIGFGTARGGDLDAVALALTNQRAGQR